MRAQTHDTRQPGLGAAEGSFINSGHGMLGWTLACGSARLTTNLMDRRQPAIEPGAFALRHAT